MAAVFSYDPNPPRVSSPWPENTRRDHASVAPDSKRTVAESGGDEEFSGIQVEDLDINSVTRLDAEPQEGPTEYKLHLLLRPRKSLSSGSTTRNASGSYRSPPSTAPRNSLAMSSPVTAGATSSAIYRQHRLEQLTTQLLWRLQQSSPYHSTSANKFVLPLLPPAAPELRPPEQLAKLPPGLEESKGALYEIGVSDDGTLVGLTLQEMNESLNNLRAMAGSLGCSVEVQRMICVGECEWDVEIDHADPKLAKLYVAEAFVKPEIDSRPAEAGQTVIGQGFHTEDVLKVSGRAVEQLRVSLTGATTCGKSSLLGTLSTSTLDNGRGKSRLSLLKHRHEIASGITSSVAQELIGYEDDPENPNGNVKVLNYACEDISAWNDIHASHRLSRLALLSDSAGHPRFRRTTVRGLVGWAPHWTFLCIAANEDHTRPESIEESEYNDSDAQSPFPGANAHISIAHLDLCLKLQIPFVIVITKLDEATRSSLRQLLSSLLTRLKNSGRTPVVVGNRSTAHSEMDLASITRSAMEEIREIVAEMSAELRQKVLILLTSAVTGAGIEKLHALLRVLPISPTDSKHLRSKGTLFGIDDSFSFPTLVSSTRTADTEAGSVVSGIMSHGSITVGEELALGPFPSHSGSTPVQPSTPDQLLSISGPHGETEDSFLSPRSFSDALARTTSSPRLRPSDPSHDWRRVRVVSIRNLKLPTRTLYHDQVGTIGVIPIEVLDTPGSTSRTSLPLPPIRKGMVLATGQPSASHTFTARFGIEEAASVVVGSVVVVYCSSLRAGARVVAVALDKKDGADRHEAQRRSSIEVGSYDEERDVTVDEGTGFLFDDGDEVQESAGSILVTFQFVAYKEWVEVGSKVLVMPSGGLGGDRNGIKRLVGGLEGYVGQVTETFGQGGKPV